MLNLSAHYYLVSSLPVTVLESQQYVLVKAKSMSQYTTSTGQNTGMSNTRNQLQRKPIAIARVAAYQNLNSGSRLTNGLNSCVSFVGSESPSSMLSSCSREGSNLGDRKARKRLRR